MSTLLPATMRCLNGQHRKCDGHSQIDPDPIAECTCQCHRDEGAQQWHDEDRAANSRHQPCARVQDCLDCKALNPYLAARTSEDSAVSTP